MRNPKMNATELVIESDGPKATQALGQVMGAFVQAGTIIAFYGDLGAGKTAFVQGLARGLDVPPHYYVTSPSYTLINQYPGRLTLYHVDLYRIDAPEAIEELGLMELMEHPAVMAIEWAEHLSEPIFRDHLSIRLEVSGPQSRKITIKATGLAAINLIKALKSSA
jgi:tRNA threonylcarbamoyladenosine biosynthesis protein TsaE